MKTCLKTNQSASAKYNYSLKNYAKILNKTFDTFVKVNTATEANDLTTIY